ncbi:Protein of unknown function [Pyronema omphalodes CBS 100304]|uniref:Uncharacterized protein n=1 Tax=Pyronema omphalodes (strain CBS 100304) TaxID=1076935 RepID=U4LRP0_PYROM|nr:Protein of unknown function [Pyronema omphalodes CBS 100304]
MDSCRSDVPATVFSMLPKDLKASFRIRCSKRLLISVQYPHRYCPTFSSLYCMLDVLTFLSSNEFATKFR